MWPLVKNKTLTKEKVLVCLFPICNLFQRVFWVLGRIPGCFFPTGCFFGTFAKDGILSCEVFGLLYKI